jgi:hypothetical protein
MNKKKRQRPEAKILKGEKVEILDYGARVARSIIGQVEEMGESRWLIEVTTLGLIEQPERM